MAVTVGVDTWVTVAEADAYFARRVGATAWAALSSADKEALLVTAFNWLLYDSALALSEGSDHPAIRHAQMEAAWFLLNYREDYERRQALRASGVVSMGTRVWSETLSEVKKPANVFAALSKAGVAAGGGVFVDIPGD